MKICFISRKFGLSRYLDWTFEEILKNQKLWMAEDDIPNMDLDELIIRLDKHKRYSYKLIKKSHK